MVLGGAGGANKNRALQLFGGSGGSAAYVPDRVDWVEEGGVTHVKDQGRCGCCWAVSLSGAIEGGVYSDPKNDGYLQSLSFQQFISCSKINGGCDGGNLALASLYSQINLFQGVTRLNDYPYTDYFGKTTTECLAPVSFATDTDQMPLAVSVDKSQIVAGYDKKLSHNQRVQAFKEALAVKPVAIAMKSQCRTISNYRKGVMTDDKEIGRAHV